MNKLIAEAFGTAVLVFLGCGSVALSGFGGTMPLGILPISLAFGLAVTAMAYGIGPVSGCHINPAVTAAVWAAGRMPTSEAIRYVIAQVIGGFIGMIVLSIILFGKNVSYTGGLGANAFSNYSVVSAFVIEFVGTLIFTVVILGVTQSKAGTGAVAGLAIGLTLTLIHLVLIPVTGTSVNPARSIAPAIFEGGRALAQVWLFILAPIAGGLVAGYLFRSRCLAMQD